MKVISSVPTNGGELEKNTNLVLIFDEPIDNVSFNKSMLYIEREGNNVDYDYSINNNELTITLKSYILGKYYLYLTGYDVLNNLYLKSTSGNNISSDFAMSFDVIDSQQSGGNTNNETTITQEYIVLDDDEEITAEYSSLILQNQFRQTFSSQIQQPFDITVIIENFDGSYTINQYNVSDISTPAYFTNNVLVVNFETLQPNSMVTIETSDITFTGDIKQSFNFTALTNLNPYINMNAIKQKLGSYQSNISREELYYAQLSAMIAYEQSSGTQIIGQQITQEQKMFIQKYQYLELLQLLLNKKMIDSGNSINTGIASLSFGNVTGNQIDYINQQKDELLNNYIKLSAKWQDKQYKYNYSTSSRAMLQLEMLRNIIGGEYDDRPIIR